MLSILNFSSGQEVVLFGRYTAIFYIFIFYTAKCIVHTSRRVVLERIYDNTLNMCTFNARKTNHLTSKISTR